MKTLSTKLEKKVAVYNDEALVEMLTALGCYRGYLLLPKRMLKGFKKLYFDTKTVNSNYLFINGKEISDNKNHNPFADFNVL